MRLADEMRASTSRSSIRGRFAASLSLLARMLPMDRLGWSSVSPGARADSSLDEPPSKPKRNASPESPDDEEPDRLHDSTLHPREEPPHAPLSLAGSKLGRFVIDCEIGRGGGGIVCRAIDPRLSRTVALKLPWPQTLAHEGLRRRFLREAPATARLKHPNIVTVYEAGAVGGVTYIAYEYCAGRTLAQWIKDRQDRRDPPRALAELIRTLAEAVQHAHDHRILHRDIKPSNVMLVPRPERSAPLRDRDLGRDFIPKLTDFGLAKVLDDSGELSQTGAGLGTASYMPPEQAKGQNIDIRSDVYALGAVLYELLTGRPPFQGESRTAILLKVVHEEPVEPRVIRREIPRDLEAVCLKCLEKAPERRYASAQELADDLGRVLDGRSTLARPVSPLRKAGRWCRRNPYLVTTLGALVAAAVGWSILIFSHLHTLSQQKERLERQLREIEIRRYASDMGMAYHALMDSDVEQATDLLRAHIPGPGEPDRRGFEWYYLWRFCQHFQPRILSGHGGDVYGVFYSADGRMLLSTSQDGTARLWDVASGRELRVFGDHEGEVSSAAFSPDGTTLATASDDFAVRIFDLETGALDAVLLDHTDEVFAVGFTRDGRTLISAGRDADIRLWDLETNRVRTVLKGHEGRVESLALSPDGQTLASVGRDRVVRFWNVADGSPQAEPLGPHPDRLYAVAYSPDGRWLATGCETGEVFLWDLRERQVRFAAKRHTDLVYSVAFSPDGRTLASAGKGGLLQFWDIATGDPRTILEAHDGHRIWFVNFAPDGQTLATASADGTVRVWDAEITWGTRFANPPPGYSHCVAITPDGRTVVSGDFRGSLWLWDAATGQLESWLDAMSVFDNGMAVMYVAISPDGRLLAVGDSDQKVTVYDLASLRPIAVLPEEDRVLDLAFAPDGRTLAVGLAEGRISLWDLDTWQRRFYLYAHEKIDRYYEIWPIVLRAVAFSPDGRRLASVGLGDQTIKLWDVETGGLLTVLHAPGLFRCVAFAPDGRTLASGDDDGAVRLWNVETGEHLAALWGHHDRIYGLVFSPDGRTLVSSEGGDVKERSIRFWNVASQEFLFTLDAPIGHVNRLAFSSDGRRLVASGSAMRSPGGDGQVLIWDAADPSEIRL